MSSNPAKSSLTAAEIFSDAPEAIALAMSIKESINTLNTKPTPHSATDVAGAFGIAADGTVMKACVLADKMIAQSKT
jgi:hypothetical protein